MTLYLHGFLGDSADWEGIADADAIVPNLPHEDLISLLPNRKCHLVGYSMGGRIAMRLKTLYPDLFDKVILISAHPGIAESEKKERWKLDQKRAEQIKKVGLQEFLISWYNASIFSSLRTHEAFPKLLARRQQQSDEKMARLLLEESIAKQPSYWDHIAGMHFLIGERDEKYKALVPRLEQCGAHVDVIPGCGHALHIEKPKVCRKIIEEKLYGNSNARMDIRRNLHRHPI